MLNAPLLGFCPLTFIRTINKNTQLSPTANIFVHKNTACFNELKTPTTDT